MYALLDKLIPPLVSHLVKFCVWFIWITSKVKINIDPESKAILSSNKPVIAALWHNRILLMPKFMKRFRPLAAVISAHRDGEFLAKFLMRYNQTGIRGSSRRGGFSAIKQVMQHLKDNGLVVITPDGPLGPCYNINGNITNIAIKSNSVIIPISYSVKKAKVLKTWDKFIIPHPFNYIVIDVMKPINLSKSSEAEQNKQLQDIMLKQIQKLDEETGLNHA